MRLLRALRHLLILALALAVPRPCWAQTSSAAEQRVALIIGNADYDDSPLKNPVNDARLMANTLAALGFRVLLKLDAPQREMKQAIEEFGSQLARGGTAVFYFAGHGVQSGGRNYMIPVGAQIHGENFVDIESVDVQRVLATMEAANTDVNLVILDACRNNPFQQSMRSQSRGLAFISAPRGTLIAYATAPGAVAIDGSGNHGIYTAALAEEIGSAPGGIEQVLKRVRTRVRQETGNAQVPWESSSLEGEFSFHGSAQPYAASSFTPAPRLSVPAHVPPPQVSVSDNAVPAPAIVTPAAAAPSAAEPPTRSLGTHRVCKPGCILSLTGGIGLLGMGLAGQLAGDGDEDDPDVASQNKGYQTVGYIGGSLLTGLGLLLYLVSEEPNTTARGVVPYVTGSSAGLAGRF